MELVKAWFLAAVADTGPFQLLAALIVFLLFLLLRGILIRFVFGLISKIASRSKTKIDFSFFLTLEAPLKNFIPVMGLYLALNILPLGPTWKTNLTILFRALIVVFVAWVGYNLVEDGPFKKISRRYGLDSLLADFLVKAIKVVIAALAIIMIVQQLGYDINGFVAGLGLGGLAVALAAKDALSNIFAGIVIIADKPFSVGDWISTPQIEGTVEQVSFRSTRIRTFAQALVTVPNAVLANEAVTNWSRMGKRQITFDLGLSKSTPREQIQKCVARIRSMLETDPQIHRETIFIHFNEFGDSSLNIFLYFFTITTNWGEFLQAKEEVNFKIMEILEDEGVALALPVQKIHLTDNP